MEGNTILYLLAAFLVAVIFLSSSSEVNSFNGNKDLLNVALDSSSNGVSNNVDEIVNTVINGPKVYPSKSNSFKWKSTTGDEIVIADTFKEDVVLYIVMTDGTAWKAMETKVPYNVYFRDYIIDQNVIGGWERLLFPNRIPNTEEYWHDYLPKYSSNYDVREGGYLGITSSEVPLQSIPKFLGYHLMKGDRKSPQVFNKINSGDKVRLPNDFVNNLPDLSKPVENQGVVNYMHNFKKRHVPYESLLDMPHSLGNYCNMNSQPINKIIDNVATGRRSII